MATRDDGAGAWYHRGLALCSSGDYNRAISCYDKALEHSPDDPLLWRRRGFALLKAGRYAEAAASFDRALAIDPDDATAWQRKGYALACMGRVEDSIACCNQALELNPKHILAWQNKGWVLGSACRYDEAAACYEAVLRLDPNRESAAWHREYLRRKKELEALASEIREAEKNVDVPACIRDVVKDQDYQNVGLARAVLRELVRQAEQAAIPHR